METRLPTTPPSATVKTLQILNLIGFLIMVGMNFLANYLPINGRTTGELSDKYANLFVPTGLTFSIWGVIYLALLGFTLYQVGNLFSTKASRANTITGQIGIWYFVSSLLNAIWIIVWHYELVPVSVAVMLLLLVSLLILNFGITNIAHPMTGTERFLTKAPFGLYLGWICVATIANVTAWLTGIRWQGGFEQDTWAVIMICAGTAIALFAAVRMRNGYLSLAVVWAFAGIVLKRLETEPLFYSIVFVAAVGAFILLIYSAIGIAQDFKKEETLHPEPSRLYR